MSEKKIYSWAKCWVGIDEKSDKTDEEVYQEINQALLASKKFRKLINDGMGSRLPFQERAFANKIYVVISGGLDKTNKALEIFARDVEAVIRGVDGVLSVDVEVSYNGRLALATEVPVEVVNEDKLREAPLVSEITGSSKIFGFSRTGNIKTVSAAE